MSAKVRFVVTVGAVTAFVVGTLIALWTRGELSPWHVGAGTLITLTALLKNIHLYRNSLRRPPV